MKGTAKRKVLTSGRLSGGVKGHPARRRVAPNPGAAVCRDPGYTLYSADSRDQVASLHQGLDRCAALLGGILQAENADTSLCPDKPVKAVAAKPRPSTSTGKKVGKKAPTKTARAGRPVCDEAAPAGQKGSQVVPSGAGGSTPRTPHLPAAAHSGVKLHPPQRRLPLPASESRTHQAPQTPVLLSVSRSPPWPPSHTHRPSSGEGGPLSGDNRAGAGEEDFLPVRDVSTPNTAAHTYVEKMSHLQLEPGQAEVPQDPHKGGGAAEVGGKPRMIQYLLGELRALIAGQGSVAEKLLSHLEQTLSAPPLGGSTTQAGSPADLQRLQVQNTQLLRRVKTLNQQLREREKAERQQNTEDACNSQVSTLQEELTSAQSRVQEVQSELTELRRVLQDTQNQLRDREAENALMKTDVELIRAQLQHCEQERSELLSFTRRRLEGDLCRICPSGGSSVPLKQQHQQSWDPSAECVARYLRSLGQLGPPHVSERVPAERDANTLEREEPSPAPPTDTSQHHEGGQPAATTSAVTLRHPNQSRHLGPDRLSQCDEGSVCSDWSVRSGSTFDTRDEAAFRDGLAALDASIASLQRTIQLDLGR
ncbi:uncharacterized protein ccdc14 [Aulostomus maculatus]